MSNKRLFDWVQILTGIAVIVGLVLVVWELKQTKDLVRAQLLSDGFVAHMNIGGLTLSENFASVRARACFVPDELTDSELYEMYAYHDVLFSSANRMKTLHDAGVFPESWRNWSLEYLQTIMSTKAGQADLATFEYDNPKIQQLIDELIANDEIDNCRQKMGLYFERARSANPLGDRLGDPR